MKKFLFFFTFVCLLFLFSSCETECRHDNLSEKAVQPTCTESGHTQYTCNDCGYTYLDRITEPRGHEFNKKVTPVSCTRDGYTEYSCDCGFSYISDYVSASGHDYADNVKTATCEMGGYTTHTCKACGYSYVSNHTDPKGHRLTVAENDPTCEAEGVAVYSCECGYSYTIATSAPVGHDMTEIVTAPTCIEVGYTTFKCKNCDHSYVSDYTEPLGHDHVKTVAVQATCTDEGKEIYTCACGDTYSIITSPLGHNFDRLVTMPTLSDMGYTDFTCKNEGCGFNYTGEFRFYSDILKNAYSSNTEVLAKGIDISHHNYKSDANGYISLDWDAVKAAGIEYVIIRAGDASIGLDPTFEISYTDAKAAGLDVGVYFYTRATSVDEIRREAYLVLSALEGKQFEYPIYLDLEDESLMGIDPAILNEMCVEFFTILQRSGYYTGLYVNHEWLYNLIDKDTALSRFEIWYARYPALSEGEEYVWNVDENGEHLGMWQYTDSGMIEGIDTVFDLNFAYKDYPTLIKEGGFNGYNSDVKFPDTDKSFVWVIHTGDIKIRAKSDFFLNDGYDSNIDVIGYAKSGERFEVVEINEKYTAIIYNGEVAYISANPEYVSFTGIYTP